MTGEKKKRMAQICDNLAAADEEQRRIKAIVAKIAEGKIKWNGRKVVLMSNPDDWKIETLGFILQDTKKKNEFPGS